MLQELVTKTSGTPADKTTSYPLAYQLCDALCFQGVNAKLLGPVAAVPFTHQQHRSSEELLGVGHRHSGWRVPALDLVVPWALRALLVAICPCLRMNQLFSISHLLRGFLMNEQASEDSTLNECGELSPSPEGSIPTSTFVPAVVGSPTILCVQ